MVKFIELAKAEGIVVLGTKIRELQRSMGFLLDNYLFEQKDLDLNSRVLLWPHEIGPIFDRNEELTAEVRGSNENLLYSKREKILIELDKIQKRVEEFTDYGELEMMKQYVDDVKSVQKRIAEAENLIAWIQNVNIIFKIQRKAFKIIISILILKEEVQFKMQRSEFPLIDTIKVNLDPFARLFQTVLKWQRAEKK